MSKESKEWEKMAKDIVPTFDKATQTENSPKLSIVSRIQQIINKADKEDMPGLIILAHGKKDSILMKKISSHAKQIEKEESEISDSYEK